VTGSRSAIWVQIDVTEGVGHFLHLERPEAIAARITAFLESLERESLHAHQG
ncbi:MAG: alpha/beta hydrolase, partial [Myxococcales bacterium]|nr:alpha/beta hydrolase [Myxococcales bacterium]